jgi:hypothetical protein
MTQQSGASPRRVRFRTWPLTLGFVFVGAVFVTGLLLVILADEGHKWSNVGIGLLAGVIPGVALLIVQRSFERITREQDENRALSASVEPTSGKSDQPPVGTEVRPATVLPAPALPIEESGAVATERHHYVVQHAGRQRDTSRVDAMQARLRVFRDEEYYQFVVAVASGIDLRLIHGVRDLPNEQLWHAICKLAARQIEEAIKGGDLPLSAPTDAYEVFPDVEQAVRDARNLPGISEGEIVDEFDLP